MHVTQSFVPCTQINLGEDSTYESNQVVPFIESDTTCEDFEKFCKQYPSYKLIQGNFRGTTALCRAAAEGNVPLIEYIYKVGGSKLLCIGNQSGLTPLHCTVLCKNVAARYFSALTLLRLGANPNMCDGLKIHKDATPLDDALIAQQTELAILFLRFGAIPHASEYQKNEKYQSCLSKANRQMEREKLLMISVFDQDSLINQWSIPRDVINIILNIYPSLDLIDGA